MRTNTAVGLGGKLRECFDLKASVPNDKILAIIMTHHKKNSGNAIPLSSVHISTGSGTRCVDDRRLSLS